MNRHLQPLREAQQFSFCEEVVAYSIYPRSHTAHGNVFNLRPGVDLKDLSTTRDLLTITLVEKLAVTEVWWAIGAGWFVSADLGDDAKTTKKINFIQYIEPDIWKEHYATDQDQPEIAVTVCDAAWPDPSPSSLRRATYALLNEHTRGTGGSLRYWECRNLAAVQLSEGLPRALEILREGGVSDPESRLRERGFSI